MLIKLLQNQIKFIILVKIVKNMLFLEKVSKANNGESAVTLSEHVAEDSEESHPMLKCT